MATRTSNILSGWYTLIQDASSSQSDMPTMISITCQEELRRRKKTYPVFLTKIRRENIWLDRRRWMVLFRVKKYEHVDQKYIRRRSRLTPIIPIRLFLLKGVSHWRAHFFCTGELQFSSGENSLVFIFKLPTRHPVEILQNLLLG